ncbi:hypothetical protein ACQP1W_33545 [Spirillospora sp. CA-255316]
MGADLLLLAHQRAVAGVVAREGDVVGVAVGGEFSGEAVRPDQGQFRARARGRGGAPGGVPGQGDAPRLRLLRTFLAELIEFQAAHHPINDRLEGLDLPATTARRAELADAIERMIDGARGSGAVRADIAPALLTTLVGRTAFAIARARPASAELTDAYLTILMDDLRPQLSPLDAPGGEAA